MFGKNQKGIYGPDYNSIFFAVMTIKVRIMGVFLF